MRQYSLTSSIAGADLLAILKKKRALAAAGITDPELLNMYLQQTMEITPSPEPYALLLETNY